MQKRSLPIGDRRRFEIAVTCLLAILMIASAASGLMLVGQRDIGDVLSRRAVEVPKPLRSRDLQNWMKELAPSDAQRIRCEQAFDAYVEQWQQYRDQTVRPAQAKHEAADGSDAAEAAWRTATARAYEQVSQLERSMFDAMRSAQWSAEQQSALDRDAAARARKRAGAVVRGVPLNLPKTPAVADLPAEKLAGIDRRTREWEMSATPIIERLATASLDDKAADRAEELERKLLASERAAVKDIAANLPADAAAKYLDSFRRQALPSGQSWGRFAYSTPESLRERVGENPDKAALDAIAQWRKQREALEEAALDAMTGDKISPEAMAELESKYKQVNASGLADIAQASGMPELATPVQGMTFSFDGADGDGVIGLGDVGELSSGDGNTMVFSSSDVSAEGPGDSGTFATHSMVVIRADGGEDDAGEIHITGAPMVVTGNAMPQIEMADAPGQPGVKFSTQAGETAGSATPRSTTNSNAMVMATSRLGDGEVSPFGFMRRVRPMSRQDIEQVHARLAVPDAQRALWDSLASDLLQSNAEWLQGAPTPEGGREAIQQKRREHDDELAKLEDAWFENVKAGVQGIDAAQVDGERHRREFVRAFGAARGSAMPLPEILQSRWGRADLFAATDAISAEARAKARPALDAWCAQVLQELAPLADRIAAYNKAVESLASVQEDVSDEGGGVNKMQFTMSMDDKQSAELEKFRKPVDESWKRIEQAQAAGVDSVAAALGEADAKSFRRAVRRQTHPEVFRTQERVDSAVERVQALPSMTPEQSRAVAALVEDYRRRCDAMTEQSIAQIDRSDAAISRLIKSPSPGKAPDEIQKNARDMQVTQRIRGDAGYDREELNARAMRRLRAALSPEQAAAAKLN